MKIIKNSLNEVSIIIKLLFIISAIFFVMPSIIYLIQNGTIYNFNKYFEFLLNDTDRTLQTIIYIMILFLMTVLYFIILKQRKEMFKNIKDVIIFVAIIGTIFLFAIPFTSSDIFYYLGVGRISSVYDQNPYYTTINQFVDNNKETVIYLEKFSKDTVLQEGYNNYWANTTVVYGPIWTIICAIISAMSFGNIDFGLLLFKIINLLVHIVNCYLLYKISGKKIFSLIYGLNPFILIEGIMCVHNDIFVVLFILLALYCLLKKKKILVSVIFLSLATAIKYFAILLLPFLIIYYFKKETSTKRLIKCIQYGLIFSCAIIIPYLMYVQDINVLSGILTQQEKIAKSFYLIILEYFITPDNLHSIINTTLLSSFIIIYFLICVSLLFKKDIKVREELRKAEYILVAFLFLLITNFQPWYIIWIFPLIIWQKAENIKLIIQISLLSQFANSIFLAYTENWKNGIPFVFFIVVGTLMCAICNIKKVDFLKSFNVIHKKDI